MCDDNDSVLDDDDWSEYDSGPFCSHWGDPTDCEILCKCGHKCKEHYHLSGCDVEGCECQEFQDKEPISQP